MYLSDNHCYPHINTIVNGSNFSMYSEYCSKLHADNHFHRNQIRPRLVTILKFLYDSIEIKIFFFLFVGLPLLCFTTFRLSF